MEKNLKLNIVRQVYCMQGTEWDLLLIVTAQSQDEYVEYISELAKEGWITKIWSMIPVELGEIGFLIQLQFPL